MEPVKYEEGETVHVAVKPEGRLFNDNVSPDEQTGSVGIEIVGAY
jgi:hypothetical protein